MLIKAVSFSSDTSSLALLYRPGMFFFHGLLTRQRIDFPRIETGSSPCPNADLVGVEKWLQDGARECPQPLQKKLNPRNTDFSLREPWA